MSIFIGAESIVINALIDANEKHNKQELNFQEIVRYGKTVARIYRRETDEDAILLLSMADQVSMMESYSQYLDTEAYAERRVFKLREDAPMDEIVELFRWLLGMKLMNAFLSPEAAASLQD